MSELASGASYRPEMRIRAPELKACKLLIHKLRVKPRCKSDARSGFAWRRATRIAIRHGGFILRRLLPHFVRIWRCAGSLNANYFCIVSHHFMSAAEMNTAQGQARLALCAFQVPMNGRLESMCAVNALGLREAYYHQIHRSPSKIA